MALYNIHRVYTINSSPQPIHYLQLRMMNSVHLWGNSLSFLFGNWGNWLKMCSSATGLLNFLICFLFGIPQTPALMFQEENHWHACSLSSFGHVHIPWHPCKNGMLYDSCACRHLRSVDGVGLHPDLIDLLRLPGICDSASADTAYG